MGFADRIVSHTSVDACADFSRMLLLPWDQPESMQKTFLKWISERGAEEVVVEVKGQVKSVSKPENFCVA